MSRPTIQSLVRAFCLDERGVTSIEYSLIGSLTVVGAIGAMDRFGQSIADNLYDIIGAIARLI